MNFNDYYMEESKKYQIFCDMDSVLSDFINEWREGATVEDLHDYEETNGTAAFWQDINSRGIEFWSGIT